MFWQWRFVAVPQELHLLFTVVKNLQEKHPAELLQALRIAIGAGVFAHDVLDGFDEVGNIGHCNSSF